MRYYNKPKYLLLILLFCSLSHTYAQIGGLTASKINSFNHAPIPKGSAEFEPNVTYSFSSKSWDDQGELKNTFSSLDSISVESGISFRMAYTLTDLWEVGTIIASDYSSWSVKRELMTKGPLGLGIMAGINVPYGITTIDRSLRAADQVSNYGIGLISSYELSIDASIDLNVQYQDYFHAAEDISNSDIFISLDYGHYINQQNIYLIASFLYQNSSLEIGNLSKLTFSPGISIEMKKSYLIVINANLDLTGQNTDKTNGFNVAWTMTL